MVGGLKKAKKCLGWFRHQQTYYLEDYKYETAVLGIEKCFSIILKSKNADIHTRQQTFKNT
jgi:hypothetical protein